MADVLFITPYEITSTTIVGGNVDIDKYLPFVKETQLTTIQSLLGTQLYDKILSDVENDTLTGLYLTMFNDYIKPITKYQSVASYILESPLTIGNGGLFTRTYQGVQSVDYKEVERISQIYSSKAQPYIMQFDKWIKLNVNNIPEYKINQDEVNAQSNINLNNGWYFGN